LIARGADALLRAYSHIAPTVRGSYRLARLARRLHPPDDRVARFRTPDGFDLQLDLGVYPDCCMAFGLYELETARLIRKLLRPGATFIDGGANIGYFTLIAAKAVGEHGTVHAFEPQPETRERLAEHVRANGAAGVVKIHPVALSDRAGTVQLYSYTSPEASHGHTTMFAGRGMETLAVTVETVRLDDYLPDVAPSVIKLDIEGAEPLAIEGMTETLRRHRPAVIMELHPMTLSRAGFSVHEPIDRLHAAVPEYRAQVIDWRLKPLRDVERLSLVNLLFR
jgi:FkbM family methyltransferase